jgi:hypothetical protein
MFGKRLVLSNSLLIAFLISFCFLVFSCASSKMEIQTNPSIPNPEYTKLAVLALANVDIEKRRSAEKIFITSLAKKGISAESCIEMFPSIKEYSDKEIKEIARVLNERKIQAVLIIDFGETINDFFRDTSPTTPPTTVSDRPVRGIVLETPIQTVSANYIVKVVDIATGENSFYATDVVTSLSGGIYTNWEALVNPIANKTIQAMQKNFIIKPVKKQ